MTAPPQPEPPGSLTLSAVYERISALEERINAVQQSGEESNARLIEVAANLRQVRGWIEAQSLQRSNFRDSRDDCQ
jgi:hypothetical protein